MFYGLPEALSHFNPEPADDRHVMRTTLLEFVEDSQERLVVRDKGHFVELHLSKGSLYLSEEMS